MQGGRDTLLDRLKDGELENMDRSGLLALLTAEKQLHSALPPAESELWPALYWYR